MGGAISPSLLTCGLGRGDVIFDTSINPSLWHFYLRERVEGCKRLHQNCLHPSTDVNDFGCDAIFYMMMIKRHSYLRERVEGCKRLHQNRLHPSTDVNIGI